MRNSPQRCTGVRQFGRTNRSFVNGRHCTSIESRADTPCEFASRDSLPGSGDQRGAHQGGAQRPQHEEPAREADHPAPRNGRSATSGRAGGHPPRPKVAPQRRQAPRQPGWSSAPRPTNRSIRVPGGLGTSLCSARTFRSSCEPIVSMRRGRRLSCPPMTWSCTRPSANISLESIARRMK